MWCNKCDRSMGYEDSHGYGDYSCGSCGTFYSSDKEYDEYGDEIDDEEDDL